MALIKNGVPEEIAWELTPSERLARIVVFGQLDGGDFDWDRLKWKEPKK